MEFGRQEKGEVVQVETWTTGRVLSKVKWTQADGEKYTRVTV